MDGRPSLPSADARRCAEQASQILARDPRVRLVYAFGSAVQPGREMARDVDLAVLAEPPISLEQLMRLRADLISAVEAPIDVVSLDDAPIVLAYEIVESGVCLYTRTPDIETDFVTRARARYWDFQPYRDEQWRLAGGRLAERARGS